MNIKKLLAILISLAILPISAIPANATDATAKPDPKIAAEDLSLSPTVIKDGISVYFKAKVRNGSTVKATNVKIRAFAGNVQLGEKIISSISANSYYSASITYKIPATMTGEQTYRLVVDPDNAIDESNEANNEASKSFTVLSNLPDLSVAPADMSFLPATLKSGDKGTFKATIHNLGVATAKNIPVKFYLGQTIISETVISSISANSKSLKSITYTIPTGFSGNAEYKVVADPLNIIQEISETNNEAVLQIGVSAIAKPDPKIVAEDLSFSPTTISQGASVTFKAKVSNGSSTKVTGVKARFFLGNLQIGEKTISSISGNSYYSTSLIYKIPNTIYGEQLYKLVIDPDSAIAEGDETNNTAEIKISIGEMKPDLEVAAADLSTSKENPQGGDKVTLKANVENIGNYNATDVLVRFMMNDTKIYEKTVSTISKNSKSSVTYVYQLPDVVSGGQIFKVIMDPNNAIAEFNETNNSAELSIATALTERNLVLESLSPSSAYPKPGQKMSWKLKVKNTGNAAAKNVKLALYTDVTSPTPSSTIIISTLSGGSSQTKSINWTVPQHLLPVIDYPVRAEVDSNNLIAETNEFDNIKSSSVSFKVPDISLGLGEFMNLNAYNIYNGTFSQVRVKVKNDNVDIVKNIKLTLYYALDLPTATRTKLSEITISTIAKNATYDHMFDRIFLPTLPIGTTAYLIVAADSADTVTEFNETNNELVFRRNVVVRPAEAQYPYLNVTVQDDNGDSLRNATVKLSSSGFTQKTKTTGSDSLVNNATGMVVFDALPASGQFTVTVSATGYRTQTETFTYTQGNDNSMYKTYTMDKKAVLSGTVKNQAGTPLAYATVKIDGIGLETTTDVNGKYGFMLNGGTYTLKFLKTGYGRIIESNLSVPALSTITLDKTMTAGTAAYVSGMVTNDEGTGLANTDIYVNGTMIAVTASDGRFTFNNMSAGTKNFKFKKPGYVDTEFSAVVEAGNEYYFSFTMFKPSTDTHVERGTQIVSWHQHEGTPANSFFIPEYNVDIWWGLARVKMALDFSKTGDAAKLTKLVINNHGLNWECNKVEGEGDIETSAIDIPITIAAGSCSNKQTQMDVYKVAIESNGDEVWQDTSFWTSASDPVNTGTKSFTLNNLNVSWNDNFKVKMWVRVQKRAVIGTDGDGSGALYGYHMDKKLITWYPQKPATTVISTSWGQVGGYFLGILDNPVTAITSFTDLFTVERFNQYTMEDVLAQNFPGYPSDY